ncbi:hypothetical protein [Actimicrobium antarcticum]|uniref:Uncharacterized protein n=1 Tax=Actimicrobium antarcticum TaxID=1051899 RepID=A0ABP7TRW1_9BURK
MKVIKSLPYSLFRSVLKIVAAVTVAATIASPSSADTRWPQPVLPANLDTFSIADQMTVNGLPMRLKGFVSNRRPAEMIDAFRRSLGQPLVDSVVNGKQVLGRAEGGFYITVQIEAAGAGSKGTVAVTDLAAMSSNHAQQQDADTRWRNRLPAGSVISSQMTSQENGRAARHMVILNSHSESANRDALLRLMTEDGFALEREIRPDAAMRRSLPAHMAEASTMYFKSPGKEAMAVISRSGDKTAVVFNSTVTLQGFQ